MHSTFFGAVMNNSTNQNNTNAPNDANDMKTGGETPAQRPSLPTEGQGIASNVDNQQAGQRNAQFTRNVQSQRQGEPGRQQIQESQSQAGAHQVNKQRYTDDVEQLDPNIENRPPEKQAWGQDSERADTAHEASPYTVGSGDVQPGQQSFKQKGEPWGNDQQADDENPTESASGSPSEHTLHNPHRHYDPEYDEWRKGQGEGLDQDYGTWRREQDEKAAIKDSDWQKNSDGAHSSHQEDVAGDANRDSAINAEHADETAAGKSPSTPGHATETSVHLSK
jgi:hypothetical protein